MASDAPLDPLGRAPIADGMKRQIDAAFAGVTGRGALVLLTDTETKVVRMHVAARFGDHWKVAGGAGVPWTGKKPEGWIAIEGSW